MRRSIRLLILSVSIFLNPSSLLNAQEPHPAYSLIEQWERNLGRPSGSAFYRLTVCGDGASYLTDALGNVTLLDAEALQPPPTFHHSALLGSLALHCDRAGQLNSASKRGLVIFARGNDTLQLKSSVSFDRRQVPTPHKLAVLDDGSYFLTGSMDGLTFIHAVSREGHITRSFGAPVFQSPEELGRTSAVRGSLVWLASTQRLIFVPQNPPELHVYDKSGSLLSKKVLDIGFKPMRFDFGRGRPLPGDEVVNLTALPSGDFIMQTLQGIQDVRGRYRRSSYLAMLDRDFNLIFQWQIDSKLGLLQGASQAGTLFFVRIDPLGIKIKTAKLVARDGKAP